MCNASNNTILKRKSHKRNLRKSLNFAKKLRGGQFYKENPLNEIYENLKILLKKVRGGSILQTKSLLCHALCHVL